MSDRFPIAVVELFQIVGMLMVIACALAACWWMIWSGAVKVALTFGAGVGCLFGIIPCVQYISRHHSTGEELFIGLAWIAAALFGGTYCFKAGIEQVKRIYKTGTALSPTWFQENSN